MGDTADRPVILQSDLQCGRGIRRVDAACRRQAGKVLRSSALPSRALLSCALPSWIRTIRAFVIIG